jgi:DNA-binding transcriptional LysR family regulator
MGANGWLRLELRYLAALQAIAATGSFGRAADELGYTQSAISQQIASLERLVGLPLIDRPGGRRPVGLTAAGSLLLSHAEDILARTRIARAQLDALVDGDAGVLRVGTYQSVGVRILPGAAARLAATHPELRLEIREACDDLELVELVRSGGVEVTFCVLPVASGPFATEELLEDPYLLVVPADSPLRGTSVALEALSSLPLIGYRGCRTEQRVESYLRGLGIDLRRVALAEDNAIIQAMVAEGRGVALLTRLSADYADPRTAIVELDGWVPPRRVALAWHREQDGLPAVQAFVAAAREATAAWRDGVRPAA